MNKAVKPITLDQWKKMPSGSRDWMLCKALGFEVRVWWHVSLDGSKQKIASGSYQTKAHALAVLKHPPNKFPKTAGCAGMCPAIA